MITRYFHCLPNELKRSEDSRVRFAQTNSIRMRENLDFIKKEKEKKSCRYFLGIGSLVTFRRISTDFTYAYFLTSPCVCVCLLAAAASVTGGGKRRASVFTRRSTRSVSKFPSTPRRNKSLKGG